MGELAALLTNPSSSAQPVSQASSESDHNESSGAIQEVVLRCVERTSEHLVVRCSDLAGTELFEIEARPRSVVGALRATLVAELGVAEGDLLFLLLPDGQLLDKSADMECCDDLFREFDDK